MCIRFLPSICSGEIYAQALSWVHRLYITEVKGMFKGDTFFPKIDYGQWKEISRLPHPADENHAYAFDIVMWERKNAASQNPGIN